MKYKLRIALILVFFLVFLLLGGYLLFAWYYWEVFFINTWINGIYCTGKTVEEVNAELLSQMEDPILVISDLEGEVYEIALSDIGYQADYTEPLQTYLNLQNPLLWANNLTGGPDEDIFPTVEYDERALESWWLSLPFVQEELQKESEVMLILMQGGYELYDGASGRLDVEAGFLWLKTTIAEKNYYVSLCEELYYDIALTEADMQAMEIWDKVDALQNTGIVYNMGDALLPVDAGIVSDFITLSEDGSFLLSDDGELVLAEDRIREFIGELAEEYDTYGKERQFSATRGEVVTVKGGTYGTKLDVEAEVAYLLEALAEERTEYHIPTYIQEGFIRGKDDIGTTYIEIDMTEQKMYYYKDGECLVETSIVTGNTSRRMGTPQGVNYVYNKQTNRILRGTNYASFVSFWMPINGSVGIHDATWRSKFGGEIYKNSGSHGCINTPYDQMVILYELVEIGTPVISFY